MEIIKKMGIIEPKPNIPAPLMLPAKIYPNITK